MVTTEKLIPREVLALARFATSEDSRPVLTGVRISETHAMASDGYAAATLELEYPLEGLTGRTLLKKAALALVAKLRKSSRRAEYTMVKGNGLDGTFLATIKHDSVVQDRAVFMAENIPQTFPDLESLVSKPENPSTYIALGTWALRLLADVAKDVEADVVRLYIQGPTDAVIARIKTDAGWIRATVMPMFSPQDDTL